MKLWGGRFHRDLETQVQSYTQSLEVDARMVAEDIWASEVHAIMLAHQGIISVQDLVHILTWLEKARREHEEGRLRLREDLEDVHMNIEHYLIQGAGPEYGGKLHTARSRNDQVLTDAKLYIRRRILQTENLLLQLMRTLLDLARQHVETLMPGYTHTQHAQPITLGFWASGYASMLVRDLRRLRHAYTTVNTSPLGACALAGTSFPISRTLTARLLGFDSVHEHALDATSSRDFIVETLAALAILMTNLSKLAEEMVWWSTSEFGFLELDDAYSTGSSIMPQKKNPDPAELTRAKAALVIARLQQVLTLLKGLPMGYHRDLQEDKAPLWEAFDTVQGALVVMEGALRTARFNTQRMAELVEANYATATELANTLVREHGLPFRQAHEIVGRVVATLHGEGERFSNLERVQALLREQGVEMDREALRSVLDPLRCLYAQRSQGSTSPMEVGRMVAQLQEWALEHERDVRERWERIEGARARTQQIVERILEEGDLRSLGRMVET